MTVYHRDRVAKHVSHYQADDTASAPKQAQVQSRRQFRAANKAVTRRLAHDALAN
jgi:hypothetical protein